MKHKYILMGYCIEFHRLYGKRKKEIPIHEYICKNDVPICHRDTYLKIIKGENKSSELYEQIMKKNNIQYDFDYPLYEQTKKVHTIIKQALEFYDMEALSSGLQKGKELLTYKKEIYPHKIEYFVLSKIYDTCIQRIFLNEKQVNVLCYLLDFVSHDLQIAMIHMLYMDCHRRKYTVSSLRKILNLLPVNRNEILYQNIMIRQMIYEKEFKEALVLIEQLDKTCQEMDNISRLCEVQQYYLAIYNALGKKEEAELAQQKLAALAKNQKVDSHMRYLAGYYLGMCAFTNHEFKQAKRFFEKQLRSLNEKASFNIKFFYLSVLSYEHEENHMFAIQDIDISKLKVSEKVFIRYFIMKDKKRGKKALIQYILNKIAPIINVDHEMEASIFLQELYLLKATIEERQIYEYQLSKTNCVILQDWQEVFSNL